MRSLFSFGASKEMSLVTAGTGKRPEVLRRKTLANNARMTIIAAGLGMPLAVYSLVAGAVLPLVIATIALGGAMISLALHQRRQFEQSAAVQIVAVMAVGLLLALASDQFAGAGMAVSLMGPVLAALVARPPLRRQSWFMLAGVLALSGVTAALHGPAIVVPADILLWTSVCAFIVVFAIVGHTANRIGAAYEVYDKAQVTAYRHLIEHVQDAVLRFSTDGTILLASQTSEALFGCPRYELGGTGLSERLHVADRPKFLTAFADANRGGHPRTVEVRMRKDDPANATKLPQFIWVEIGLSPVLEGGVAGPRYEVVALFRDISERKADDAIMAEARRVAEEASEAKSRFLATIGHELRTPLNAVVGFSEMMTSNIGGELSPTHREYAGLIHQSGKHLLEVVRMLLDMSRIESGKFELQTEPFLPQSMIEPCFGMVEAIAKERDVTLRFQAGKALPMVVGDERACRQILINLLSNAIKFSNPGGVVTVSLKRQGQSLNISVNDHGIGMAPESLARIGEPFFQAQDGLSRRYEGTGLGLSIVKGLVDLHNGTLRAISEIGAGTTMTVLLPLNGPAINTDQTATVTTLHREPATAILPSWQDEKRKAQ